MALKYPGIYPRETSPVVTGNPPFTDINLFAGWTIHEVVQKDTNTQTTQNLIRYMIQTNNDLQDMVKSMSEELHYIRNKLEEDEESEELVEMSIDEIKDLILTKMDRSKPFYPSDVADKYNLDYWLVTEAIETLVKEGHLKE